MCGSEVAWLSKLQARAATLGQSLSKLGNAAGPVALKKGKAILVAYFAGSVADTNQLIEASSLWGLQVLKAVTPWRASSSRP